MLYIAFIFSAYWLFFSGKYKGDITLNLIIAMLTFLLMPQIFFLGLAYFLIKWLFTDDRSPDSRYEDDKHLVTSRKDPIDTIMRNLEENPEYFKYCDEILIAYEYFKLFKYNKNNIFKTDDYFSNVNPNKFEEIITLFLERYYGRVMTGYTVPKEILDKMKKEIEEYKKIESTLEF